MDDLKPSDVAGAINHGPEKGRQPWGGAPLQSLPAPFDGRPSPVKRRLQDFWALVMAVKDDGDHTDLRQQFMDHAHASGLVAALGRHGEEDVRHILDWGLRGISPWAKGEFPSA
jgi:hypothetical protein